MCKNAPLAVPRCLYPDDCLHSSIPSAPVILRPLFGRRIPKMPAVRRSSGPPKLLSQGLIRNVTVTLPSDTSMSRKVIVIFHQYRTRNSLGILRPKERPQNDRDDCMCGATRTSTKLMQPNHCLHVKPYIE